jgi:hypothetical protein
MVPGLENVHECNFSHIWLNFLQNKFAYSPKLFVTVSQARDANNPVFAPFHTIAHFQDLAPFSYTMGWNRQ